MMDERGGPENLDNKRREVSKERMNELDKKYGNQKIDCTGTHIKGDPAKGC